MRAADVMTTQLVTIRPDTLVADAARLLIETDVSALPVVDATGRLVGILSESDLLHRAEIGTEVQRPRWLEAITPAATLAQDFERSHGRTVQDLMSDRLVTAAPDTPLSDIANLLEKHRIKRIPITDGDRLIGIVSRSNLIQALATHPALSGAAAEPDRVIRAELLRRLGEQDWTGFGDRNVTVLDGRVHLWGLVGSAQERRALVTLAGEVPGVSGVSDEMIAGY
jgi:CBS-domain-containing membrane protein